jgi:tetratricopeptide (TPR) repeat protein
VRRSSYLVRAFPTLVLTLVLATTALAAPHPFYQNMMQRGLAKVQQGRYADAIRDLRVAAFGSLDEPTMYQTAQVYIAIANEKLGNSDEARLAATKFLQSERLRPTYASLQLDAATRDAFEKLVAGAVEPQYLAQLPAFRRSSPKSVSAVASTSKELPMPAITVPAPPIQPQTDVKAAVTPPPQPKPAAPTTTPPQATTPAPQVSDTAARLRQAQQLLNEGKLLAARQAYEQLGQRRDLSRSEIMEIGRGLNRAGAWQQSAFIYQRTLPLRKGEELHMFYEAVNRYELGEVNVARSLLAKALPGLAVTREIEQYRQKINGSS